MQYYGYNPGYYNQAPQAPQGYQPTSYDSYNMNLQNQIAQQYQNQLEQFMQQGAKKGASIYYDGSLGRVGEGTNQNILDLTNQYKTQYEQGYGAPTNQAVMEEYKANIARDSQTGLAQAANLAANQGVRGALASRLGQDQLRQTQMQRQDADRQTRLDDFGYRTAAQQQYGQRIGAQEQNELARQMYNQQQQAKELQGRLAYELGYGSLGSANLSGAQKYIAGQQQIGAAAAAPSGGGK